MTTRTLSGRTIGRWEPGFNKTILFGCRDALVVIGFSGPAYLAGKSTDHFIAEALTQRELESDVYQFWYPRDRILLGPSLWRLRQALNKTNAARNIEIVVTGFRFKEKTAKSYPVQVAWSPRGSQLKMRRARLAGLIEFDWIGSFPNIQRFGKILASWKSSPPVAEVSEIFRNTISEAATLDAAIGSDICEVRIDLSVPEVLCGFDPGEDYRYPHSPKAEGPFIGDPLRVPWILESHYSQAPFEAYGSLKRMTGNICGVPLRVGDHRSLPGDPDALIFIPERRRPPP